MKEDASICIFYIISCIATVWFFIWSIADFADANGWIMLGRNSHNDRGGATFFCAIGSILCTFIAVLTIVNLVAFWRRGRVLGDDD